MDKRGRDADKRYRNKAKDTNYKTISLILGEAVYKRLEKAVKAEDDKNMSRYIEDNISVENIKTIESNRPYKKETTIKKTFTFTEDFAEKIKSSGNMSLYVETCLKDKYNI